MADLLLTGIGQLVTNVPGGPDPAGPVSNAAVAVRAGRVEWVGAAADVPSRYLGLPELECGGRAVLPGFVDAHTHLVFAGDRSEEFARRLRGETYQQLLAGGGGIQSTVGATRKASLGELVEGASARARRMLAGGTTTVEVKSGYGLDVPTEQRMLEAAAGVGREVALDVVVTFLGAHVVPTEFSDDRDGYLRLIEAEMLPACAPLADFCDVFCDEGAFTVAEARRVLQAAAAHGLRPRLHAEQLAHTGGARLAAELGAASADHLDYANVEDAAALAAAGTAAVLLPGASLSMRTRQAPGRMLWDAGVTVALATDCNPGTSYVESMTLVIALGCLEMGLTPGEAVWAATRGGAVALGRPDKGTVAPAAVADLVVLDAPSYQHIPYRPGTDLVWKVIKDGVVVDG